MLVLCAITTMLYWGDFIGAREQLSESLVGQLEAGARIRDHALLRKGGLIGGMTMLMFFLGDWFGLPASVIALSGAAVLIAWVRPDMHRMLREVDWTTLVFFIGIFIVVGSLESSGVIGWLAAMIQRLAGDDVTLATLLMTWIPGIASGIVANIPFTAAALPVADLLTAAIPEAGQNVLYWSLILGADLGGNSTYLGSAPNIVAVGLLAQAGYPLSFGRFMRDGVPVTILTLLVASGWLLIRY
jgi:Na+/H+ antiporter NhaD/arsenite permease-like protein